MYDENKENGTYNYNYNYQPGYGAGGNAPKKKGGFFKKAVLLTISAVFFGVVSGATMFGVNRLANLALPLETQVQEQVQPETQAPLASTQVLPMPQETLSGVVTGVVIEDVSPIVEQAMPSVVAINNTMLYQSNSWFGQSQTYEVPSSGSGIIVGENDTELLIVTNHHVIEDSNTLSVTFIDESTVDAAIKGTDSESDLAVIAVPLDKIAADTKAQIKAATIGDSNTLKMGQGVIAIGNALGHGQSVTVGHVSALDREVTVDGVTRTVIQTDAAINPGNSGGALLNAKGELIGINEAKYADETVEGVGYAIPISYAMDIIEDLKLRTTKVEVAEADQGYLGIQVQNVDSTTAQMLGMPQGVYVYKIMEDSAAAASDLREKDIITKFDGETVRTNADLTGLLTYYKAGTTVKLTVQSLENGVYVEREVEVTLKNRPVEDEEEETRAQGLEGLMPRRP
ncbi:MAG: PDZ domain-containing protein [Lachnoclostridium sp.]|nr:PDZ domain-containing protein [Lachnoclostridium sp.]